MNKQEIENIKQKALEEHIPIIMDDTLDVIAKYLKEIEPKRILEIGTAVGYSAICFSEFLEHNGRIDTIERDNERVIYRCCKGKISVFSKRSFKNDRT